MTDQLHSLYVVADYPLLADFARSHTVATRLDGRAIAAIYEAHLASIDEQILSHGEMLLLQSLGVQLPIRTPAALLQRFPYMFPLAGTESRRAYIIFRGWLPAIAAACRRIDELLATNKRGFYWIHMREKYGAPSFAYRMHHDARVTVNHRLPSRATRAVSRTASEHDAVSQELNEMVLRLEAQLRNTCIVCSATSEINNDQGPWASLCLEHRSTAFTAGHGDWRGEAIWTSAGEGGRDRGVAGDEAVRS